MDKLIELIVELFLFHKEDTTGCEKKRKQIRMLQSLAAIIAIFVAFVFESMYIACWFGMLAGILEFVELSMLVYKDCKLMYPIDKKDKPRYFSKIFLGIYEDDKIPKCLFVQNMLYISIFVVCSILCVGFSVGDVNVSIWKFLLTYYLLGILILIFTKYRMHLHIFIKHFKRINTRNIRYALMPVYNSLYKWPAATNLGKCKVLRCKQISNNSYADILMEENGTLYENVLVIFEIDKNRTYKLCEICGVKYLI